MGFKASQNKEVVIKNKANYSNKIYDESINNSYGFNLGKIDVNKGLEIAVLNMKLSNLVLKNETINVEIGLI